MDALLWKQVKAAFGDAVDLPFDDRESFLSSLEPEVREEVIRLIAANETVNDFIDRPFLIEHGPVTARDYAREGTQIDDYLLVKVLGSGGMGTVYLAEHLGDGFSQKVALKLIKRGMDSDLILNRFLTERQILAGLDHPNIARMLDGGSTADGMPYFVMEYVSGEPLRDFCDPRSLDARSRIALFAKVCDAVSYAHQKLVVHRDLKPSNILVDEKGEPKLLDFGIAKLLSPDWQSTTEAATATQFRILTPEYSSPEQLRGEVTTTLTDVFSLGVVLYELLTGVRPFENNGRTPEQLAGAIETNDPEKPSVAALFVPRSGTEDARATAPEQRHSTGDADHPVSTRRSVPDPYALRGDIDNIVLKAIRHEADRRYSSVHDMLEDLQRYLDGLPVRATADTLSYRVGKFVKRHTASFAVAAAAALILTATTSFAIWQAMRADRERAAAEARSDDIRTLANSLIFDVHDSIRELPGSTPARKMIVSRALQFLDKLAAEGGKEMSLQTELAAGYERIGDVQGNPLGPNLGETDAAIDSYKKALAIRESLFAAADPANRYATAILNSKLFRVAQFAGDFSNAESYCGRATEILESLAESDNANVLYRVTAARFNQELADLLVTKLDGSVENAMERYQRALALTASIEPSPGNDVAGPDGLSLNEKILSVTQMAYKRLGQRHELELRNAEALAAYIHALEECEKLLAAGNPRKPQAEVVLAIALGNAGRLQAITGALDDGAEKVERGIAICEKAVQDDPKNVLARSELALLHWNAGQIKLIRRNPTDALASFIVAEKFQEELVKINPRDFYNLANLADTYTSIGLANEHRANLTQTKAFLEKSYAIWNGLKQRGMLPGYYSHKPNQVLALMNRETRAQ